MIRTTLAKLALTAVMASVLIGAPIAGYAQSTEQVRVDLTLKDADMLAATRMLTGQTGIQFVIENSSDPFPKITLSLNKVTAEDAIRYICQAGGASFRRDDNGVYIISRGKLTTAPVEQPVHTTNPQPTVKKPGVMRKIKMLHADAEAVYNQIAYGMAFDEVNGWRKINRFKQVSSNQSNLPTSNIYMLGQNQPQQFTPVSSQNLGQPLTGKEAGSDIMLPGEAAGQDGGGFGGFGGGGRGAQGGQGAGIGGQGAGGQGQNLAAGGLIPDGIDYITFDPTDNSIVVRGSDDQIKDIQNYISFFDVAPRQVIIKVEFITTSDSLNKALGFDWLYQRGTVFAGNTPGSFARSGDPIFVNFASGNITTRLKTILQQGRGKTVQAPIIRTLNNQAAAVQSTIQTWIFINQVVSIGNGNVISQTNPVQLPIVTSLIVRPRINEGDNSITMTLSPTLSDVGQLRRGPDGTELPDILSQTIAVVARVKNGETIVLGGLNRKQDTGSTSRFPILSDLPIIGQFFRANTRDRNNSELLIFVTPTIVEDDESGPINP